MAAAGTPRGGLISTGQKLTSTGATGAGRLTSAAGAGATSASTPSSVPTADTPPSAGVATYDYSAGFIRTGLRRGPSIGGPERVPTGQSAAASAARLTDAVPGGSGTFVCAAVLVGVVLLVLVLK